jgi:RHS repeat-associated protein
VRVVTDQNQQVIARHDFLPFGEEWNTPTNAKEKKLFTGHERDADTGLDYFGARYYRPQVGRFTTVDPLGASAKVANPQSFNRYAYALNNPLRYIDPDGMDVSKSCIEDANCQIVLKMNVIYDRGARLDTASLEKHYLKAAQKHYKHSNISLDITYSEGTHRSGEGLVSDRLNVFFEPGTLPSNGNSGINADGGQHVIEIRPNRMDETWNDYPWRTNTLEHEIGHWLLGDIGRKKSFEWLYETRLDLKVHTQSQGNMLWAFRRGTEHLIWAVQANPELRKPK